ncbi:MAG: class I SAM-dependent RNA methyltransferase [Treponemataceae bacterium]
MDQDAELEKTFTVTVQNMVFGGKCLAKNEAGKTLLVKGAVPNEKVEVVITSRKKDYDEAIVKKVITANSNRVDPKCKNFGICGGCSLQYILPEYQVELRKKILINAFERAKVFIGEDKVQCVTDKIWNYRNRFQLHHGGLMKNESNEVVTFCNCPVAVESINNFLEPKVIDKIKLYDRYFIFSDNKNFVKGFQNQEKKTCKVIGKKNAKINFEGKRNIFEGSSFNSDSMCSVELCGKTVFFDVRGFFQSNLGMLVKTAEILKNKIFGTNILDFYSGVGTFSVVLSQNFKHFTLVEHNRDAVAYAEKNLANIPHESYGLSGENFIKMYSSLKSKRHFDTVIIDPPRSGMEKSVCDWLCNSGILQIASLSCDPVTHARDISKLQNSGYFIKSIYLLDYYPHTSHIESLVILEKEN